MDLLNVDLLALVDLQGQELMEIVAQVRLQ